MLLIQSVQSANRFRFALYVECFRCRCLHPISEFEAFHSGGPFINNSAICEGAAIEAFEKIELSSLLGSGQRVGALEIVHWLALRSQPCALVNTGQESSAPVQSVSLG